MGSTSELGNRFKAEFTSQVIAVISGALLMVLLARLLNPDDYGLLFLSISVFGVIEMLSKLGIAKSAARYITEYKEKNPDQLPNIIRYSFILNLLTISIVSLGLFISYGHITRILGEPELAPFLLLGVFFLGFTTLMTFARLLLQGFEDIEAAAALRAVDRGSRLLFAVGFVLLGYGAIGALIGYIMAYAVAAAAGLLYLYMKYYKTHPSVSVEVGLRRRISEYTVPLTATSTAYVLDDRVDTILVGFFLGPIAVAYYTIGKQMVGFIETPMSALGFTLAPTYEAQKAKGNSEAAAKIYEEALVHGLLLYIPAAAGLMLVAEPLVELVFGQNYLGATPVVQVLAIYAVLQSITKITSNGLDFLGRARERAIIKGTTSILNVILNIILIPTIGVVGAAIATVITYPIYTITNVYIMHTELGLRFGYLLRNIFNTIIITLIMSILVYILADFISGFMTLFLVVGSGVAVWGIAVILTGMLDVKQIISILS